MLQRNLLFKKGENMIEPKNEKAKKEEAETEEVVEIKIFRLLNKGLTDWYRQVNGLKNQSKKSSSFPSKEEKSSLFPYCR